MYKKLFIVTLVLLVLVTTGMSYLVWRLDGEAGRLHVSYGVERQVTDYLVERQEAWLEYLLENRVNLDVENSSWVMLYHWRAFNREWRERNRPNDKVLEGEIGWGY